MTTQRSGQQTTQPDTVNPLPRHTTPGWQRFMRFFARLIMLPFARFDVQGLEQETQSQEPRYREDRDV